MENVNLLEMRKNLASLPTLKERIQILQGKIKAAEDTVNGLLEKYKEESLDVEKLQKNSLSAIILKNFGRYEDKLEKESEEMLAAKLEYDKASVRVRELKKEKEESEKRLSLLLQEQKKYEEELGKREELIKSDNSSEVSLKYRELEAEQDALSRQLVEIEEAIRAGKRAMSTARSAMDHLDSAEGWATFDVWSKGGIISHLAKYNHVDSATDDFNRLNSQLEDLHKELQDLNLSGVASLDGIDSGTRTIDFWFDNIFTDLNVRERIRDDNDRVSGLFDKISGIVYKLDNNVSDIQNKLKVLEQRKNDLLVNG
ncbi:MAG: hypothetical protein A2Y21_08145 [Clostridiales bacterium GWC2_40_7]|nr:MAG: hypothetical protein A2Y21_08145 [Clostridiales bacterium GWC2_40_7]